MQRCRGLVCLVANLDCDRRAVYGWVAADVVGTRNPRLPGVKSALRSDHHAVGGGVQPHDVARLLAVRERTKPPALAHGVVFDALVRP